MKSKYMLAAALCLCLCFTGCGSAEEAEENNAEAATETVAEALPETFLETERSVSETEAELSDDDASNDEEASGNLFHGSGYTLEIDGSKWTDIAEFMEGSVELNTADGFDGMFIRADDSGANMTFITLNAALPSEINADTYSKEVEQQYSEVQGLTLVSCQDCTLGDNKCIKTVTENDNGGDLLKAVQYFFPGNKTVLVMTFTAAESDWEELLPEFERVLFSLKFED